MNILCIIMPSYDLTSSEKNARLKEDSFCCVDYTLIKQMKEVRDIMLGTFSI